MASRAGLRETTEAYPTGKGLFVTELDELTNSTPKRRKGRVGHAEE
jgi:hypothetical protein